VGEEGVAAIGAGTVLVGVAGLHEDHHFRGTAELAG
jgi:hypothetical protein